MNPQIQTALARLSALKDALGKAGGFIGSEVKGTLANLSPAAIAARYKAQDVAQQAENDTAARLGGFPGGVAQWAEWNKTQPPLPDSTNVLGDMASKLVGVYRKFTKKK